MVEWFRCSTHIYNILCSNLSTIRNGFGSSFVTNLPSILLMIRQRKTGGIVLLPFLIEDVHHSPTPLQFCLLYIEHILIYEEEQ